MNTRKLTIAALCLTLGLVLPFFTGQIPQIGNALCPMHFPIILCGFLCGWRYGLIVGFITPLLRSFIWSMPYLFPNAIAMAFELACYGAAAGILYAHLGRKLWQIYLALIGAMLAGRIVWGAVMFVLAKAFAVNFSWSIFITGAFVTAIPGIIAQLIILPMLVKALQRGGKI